MAVDPATDGLYARHMDAKKTAAALGFVLLALSGTTVGQESYVVRPDVTDCVHVRDDASPDANVVACLAAGATLSVLSSRPYWREVDFGQPEPGWIAKRYIVPSATPPVVPVPDNMWLTVHFIDVGQGDAIWIHTADDSIDGNGIFEGKNIVIDGGPHSSSRDNPLRQYLETEAHAPAGLY